MKIFLTTLAVFVFASLMGLLAYAMMGSGNAKVGTADALMETKRMGEAGSMITNLVICVSVAALVGALFIIFVLPKIALKFANMVLDQSPQEYVAPTNVDAGRSLVMQGEFEEAVEKFRAAIDEDDPDRIAWTEIAQIQEEQFNDVGAAVATLKEGREAHDWEMDDDINFITRLASLELEKRDNRDAALSLYKEMLDLYGSNEYQANRARKFLKDLGEEV